MKSALLVRPDAALQAQLRRALAGCSVFVVGDDDEALRTLRLVDVDLVVRDCRRGGDLSAFAARLRDARPGTLLVAVGPPEDAADVADLVLAEGFTTRDVEVVLRQVADRRRLLAEIAALRIQLAEVVAGGRRTAEDEAREAPAIGGILREFTRVLAAGFNLSRVLDLFLDAIGQLLRPARSALLLPDEGGAYRVRTHRGLAPQVTASVRLRASEGLADWLATQGRPARLNDLADPEAARELTMLGGVLAVPLLAHGDLVAILVAGQPVAGGGYSRVEMETLFDLAAHLATAIRDITLHHELRREKEFNERILAHMSSGVVTIGRDHRVGIFNRRAEEILGLKAAEVAGQDLRRLPSPLGDMLFETLSADRPLPRSEIHLALSNRWLEVSTYPIRGEESAPLGAALVFEDRTDQKELAARKRQAEEFQLLARFIARIADEIKNPLVSINTFVELIDERFDDADFRKLFSSVVRRDARRLVQVFEKLAALVSEGELHFSTVDVHAVLDEAVAAVQLGEDGAGSRLQLDYSREGAPLLVRVDPGQLSKAVGYLIWYLTHNSPGDQARVSVSATRGDRDEGAVRILIGSRTASVTPEKLDRLFDPVQMVQESLIDVGPAVSQRLIEAQRGRLAVRQGRHELAFHITLPAAEA
ncbi:MAG TPA: GAF domain-containing protein [Dehalococcoidia bacterium]|nr:GAF domain-containing protein [Dehalococcoidia bacterium]